MKRREFLRSSMAATGGVTLASLPMGMITACTKTEQPLYKISLAEWSLHKAIFAGKIDHLNFALLARQNYNIEAVEYANQF